MRKLATKKEFDEVVNGTTTLVVADFTATWCPPCQRINPKVEELSNVHKDVTFVKVDVDENDETSKACGVSSMPTFLFYKNGKKVEEFSGADENKLRDCILKLK